jgi:NADH-quinone oxidoreductase subunit L
MSAVLSSLAQVAPQLGNLVSATPDRYLVLGLILLCPLLGAIINGFFGKRIGREGVYITAVATVGMSFLFSLFAYFTLYKTVHAPVAEGEVHGPAQLSFLAWEWFRAPVGAGVVQLKLRYVLDELSGVMLLVVTGVGTLIHIYSTGYMSHDEGYARYFAYLNLFMFSMLNLILGDGLVLLFVGWEGVGLCSYLLIGFWFTNTQYANAGRKAFIVNRIGDVGVILGMTILAWKTGAFEFSKIREALGGEGSTALAALAEKPEFNDVVAYFLSFGNTRLFDFWMKVLPEFTWGGAATFFLFVGCTGKSAQMPLYVWLPDAMAGPTPVSALIHAATMVTAGVYLLCRLSFVYVHFPSVMALIAVVGALTALFAASIALVQNELKKVLAYSTVSQLGFMFAACGVGAFSAGLFHVYTHAMFKACLFLGAGAVMHACRDKQDLRELGGLRHYTPHTFRTFAVATAAIIGTPFVTAGFYSKDEILFRALASQNSNHLWVGKFVFAVLFISATMTAFYMCRLLFLTFFGEFKGWSLKREDYPEYVEASEHGHDDHHGHGHGGGKPWDPPHENPPVMYGPLYVLGFMSIVAGFVGLPYLFTHKESLWGEWLLKGEHHPGKPITEWALTMTDPKVHSAEVTAMIFGFLAFALGLGLAYWIYLVAKGEPARNLSSAIRPVYQLLLDKWRVDELYDLVIVRPLRGAADFCAKIFDRLIDFLVNAVGAVPRALGAVLRKSQTGVVQTYGAVIAIGLAAMMGWVMFRPTVAISARAEANNRVTLEVHGGPGYAYQWDVEGDGTFAPTGNEFTPQTRQSGMCVPIESSIGPRLCRVSVRARNAFGQITTTTRYVELPSNEGEGR